MSETAIPMGFKALHLTPVLQDRLIRLGFTVPTPIQEQAIPVALEGDDVVGIAQTGTGKTLAFGLPMLARLKSGEVGLVLAPTRELAQQIDETLRSLNARTALLIGGAPMGRQVQQLRSRPQVLVATPGRFMDHMQQGTLLLRNVSIVVLDEADRMFDMGFAPAVNQILAKVPTNRQTMLFSATMPDDIVKLSAQHQRNPVRIEIERPGTAATTVRQELMVVAHPEKHDLLKSLLSEHNGSVLVFARTRHGARKLARAVRDMGHAAGELHSDRTLPQRREAMRRFKDGTDRVLVATDIAARGIDVKNIELVVNYDLPDNPEDYVHRIGRTGRAGASGLAITMATPEQHRDVRDIERVLREELPLSQQSPLQMPRHGGPAVRPARRQFGSGRPPGRNAPRPRVSR